MKKYAVAFTVGVLCWGTLLLHHHTAKAESKMDAAAQAERQKALQDPYANDLGPGSIPEDLLKTYPKDMQDTYNNLLLVKCAKCHSAARPLNSQFVEITGKREERDAQLAALRQTNPDLFKEPNIWKVETDIWQRYVKRMMAKPGCEISNDEGKAIWAFLVHDANERKIGKNKGAWKAHRTKLLESFKQKYPERYQLLYEKH